MTLPTFLLCLVWYILGFLGIVLFRVMVYIESTHKSYDGYFKRKGDKTTTRGEFLGMLFGALFGGVCLVLALVWFFFYTLIWDPWKFWSKPVCQCFVEKEYKTVREWDDKTQTMITHRVEVKA